MELGFATARLRSVSILLYSKAPTTKISSVHFPGAVNSKFTTRLSFEKPSTHSAIPTYRVMDSDGVIVDEGQAPLDIDFEVILTWYKNMLTGTRLPV